MGHALAPQFLKFSPEEPQDRVQVAGAMMGSPAVIDCLPVGLAYMVTTQTMQWASPL